MKRLTEKAVARLAVRAETYTVWDTQTGLVLKVTKTGRKLWIFQTIYAGQQTPARRTLGSYPLMGVAAARQKAGEWHAMVKKGIDPARAQEEQHEPINAITVRLLVSGDVRMHVEK
jgi:hypothetical protein